MKTKRQINKKKLIIIIVAALVFFLIIAPAIAAPIIYNAIFNKGHITADQFMTYYVEDFEGLNATRYEFKNDREQTLVGYMYTSDKTSDADTIGTVVLAHGFGGGGHHNYLDIINYFAENGFQVFGYDATGNDESEGDGVIGLPHGVSDCNQAINFVENSGNFNHIDNIFLWGHSWGGYSVSGVLKYHPEVKAVCAVAGINDTAEIMRQTGTGYAGPVANLGYPFLLAIQASYNDEYTSITSIDGFKSSDCPVMIIQSMDDTTVPPYNSYEAYERVFGEDDRFTFVKYEDRGHNNVTDSPEGIEYLNEFNEKYVEDLEREYKKDADDISKEDLKSFRNNYMPDHFDRAKYADMLDYDLFEDIVDFYKKAA